MGQRKLPELTAAESDWRTSLDDFVKDVEGNGRTTKGLFENIEDKEQFCKRLAEFLQARVELCGKEAPAWSSRCVQQALICERSLLCDRDQALAPFFESLDILASLLGGLQGDALYGVNCANEAMKCLNNALYEHTENQRAFLAIRDPQRGWQRLLTALEFGASDHAGFQRTCFVCMHLTAGKQEDVDSGISESFAEGCISSTVAIAAQLKQRGAGQVNLLAETKTSRDGLIAGFKLIYAIAATHPSVPQKMYQSSLLAAKVASGGSESKLEEIAAQMTLDDKDSPSLDRLGLVMSETLMIPEQQEEALQAAADELKDQVVSILMLSAGLQGFGDFLVRSGAIDSLVEDLKRRMISVLEKPSVSSVQYFKEMLPWIICCTSLSQQCPAAKSVLKTAVFPYEIPVPNLTGKSDAEIEHLANERKMQGNTPKDCLGGHLISFMTCLDSNLKRYAGELLFALCDENAGEMTRRCGYGASAHILAIKGGTIGSIIAQQEQQQQQQRRS